MPSVRAAPRKDSVTPETVIWILSVGLTVAASALWSGDAGRIGSFPRAPVHLAWWTLALCFFAAERWPISVLLRNNTFNVSLTEVPLVIGLFFSAPWEVGVGFALGMGAAGITGLSARPTRIIYNFAQSALCIGLAAIAFRAVAPADPLGTNGWVAAYAAAILVNASVLTTLVAIRVMEGRLTWPTVEQTFTMAMLGAAVNGSFGLIGAVLLWVNPQLLFLTILPVVALVSLYHSYFLERRRREGAEFLRGAGDVLAGNPELEAAILAVLSSARSAFRAEVTQLTIFPTAAEEKGYRTTVTAEGEPEVMKAVAWTDLDELLEAESEGIIVRSRQAVITTQEMLERRGVDDAMVALLQGSDHILGALFVGGHSAAYVEGFDDRDLKLFRSLAVQTATILDKGHIETTIASLAELQDKLAHQAFHDALTGLANRVLFGEKVSAAVEHASGAGGIVATLLVNLDDFSGVNETLGHAAGDDLIVEAARRISGCLRQPDTAARWGGDEFAILLEELQDPDEADIVAARVLAALKDPVAIGTDTVRLRASVGIAVTAGSELTTEDLLRRVDIAMNAAKSAGKNCTVAYVDGMELATVTRHQVRSELEQAIERDQLSLHYQPLVSLDDGRIVGTEALLRWWHPERGLIGPAEFIPIAEDSGLIVAIGTFVLREACRQTLRWQRRYPGGRGMYVSVNVSTRQLMQPLFVEEVMNCLIDIGFDPTMLVLELTESMLLDHNSPILGKLETLRRHGVRIAIDDFGTGYSSLSYLRNLPIDIIKIAKPFVDDLAGDAANADFAKAIVVLGNSMKVAMVAEGIEQTDQLRRLQEMGCQYGQGYLLCHPVGQGEIDRLLESGAIIAGFGTDSGGEAPVVIPLRRE